LGEFRPWELPAGYEVQRGPLPDDFNIKKCFGRTVMYRWDEEGWCLGTIKKGCTAKIPGTDKHYNCYVEYFCDGMQAKQLLHPDDYYCPAFDLAGADERTGCWVFVNNCQ
jgi:hypothetical protein